MRVANDYILTRIESFFKHIFRSHWSIITPVFFVIILFFIVPVFKYPITGGSDILHHTWIAEEIQRSGTIPKINPYSKTFDILSFTPLFKIYAAQISNIGKIDITTVYIVMRVILAGLYGLGVYCLVWRFFRKRILAMVSTLIVFLFSSATFHVTYNILFDVKEANYANLILLATLWVSAFAFQNKDLRKRNVITPLGMLCLALPFYHQLTTFTAYIILVSLAITTWFLGHHLRWYSSATTGVIAFSIFFAMIVSAPDLQQHGNTLLNGIQASSLTAINAATSSQPVSTHSIVTGQFAKLYHPFAIGLFLVGILGLCVFSRRGFANSSSSLMLILWWTCLAFLGLQSLGSFVFLPSRFLTLSILPLSVISGVGLYYLIWIIRSRFLRTLTVTGIIIFISLSVPIYVSLTPTHDDISWAQLHSYKLFDKFLTTINRPPILSDPLLGTRLISQSHATLSYPFERTDLFASQTRSWPFLVALLSQKPTAVADYAHTIGAQYVAIAGVDRFRFYVDANYRQLNDRDRFKLVFSAYPGTIDELSVYQVL